MTATMQREHAVRAIEGEWRAFSRFALGLSERERAGAVFADGSAWTVQDLVAHIAAWQRNAALAAQKSRREGTRPEPRKLRVYLGLGDTPNDAIYEAWRGRSWSDVVAELRAAHADMQQSYGSLDDVMLLDTAGPDGIYRSWHVPAIQHLRDHRADIDQALKEIAG